LAKGPTKGDVNNALRDSRLTKQNNDRETWKSIEQPVASQFNRLPTLASAGF